MAKHYKKYWYKVYLATAIDYDDDGAWNPTTHDQLLYETHSLNKVMDYIYTHHHIEAENQWLWYKRLNRK